MYETFYGFKEKPFNTTPDPRFFYPSDKHSEALNSLVYAINERKGFVVVTGEIGAGKTTITRTLLSKLEENTKVALITNTHLNAKELIEEILEELEISYTPGGKRKLLSQLNEYLIRQLADDVNVVLIIDEAQNLMPSVLEEVRMLSNLETETEKLIQIILIGQPELKKKLQHPRLEQFRQRIAVYYHLNPLSRQETNDYILHRLKSVTTDGTDLFTPEAVDVLYAYSQGIPRLINLLCDSALLSGYTYDTKKITKRLMQEAILERTLNENERKDWEFPEQEGTASASQSSLTAANSRFSNGAVSISKEIVPPSPKIELFCCSDCQNFTTCEAKWISGTKGEKQPCCLQCQNFDRCLDNAKKAKLN